MKARESDLLAALLESHQLFLDEYCKSSEDGVLGANIDKLATVIESNIKVMENAKNKECEGR